MREFVDAESFGRLERSFGCFVCRHRWGSWVVVVLRLLLLGVAVDTVLLFLLFVPDAFHQVRYGPSVVSRHLDVDRETLS